MKPVRPCLSPGRRVYAIGDVHGHIERLLDLHDMIRADLRARPVPEPTLLHIGDLIDRGPDSAGVLALLLAGPPLPELATVNLMGNHEEMLLDALFSRDPEAGPHWAKHGGEQALASWGIAPGTPPAEWAGLIPPAHVALIRDLRKSWQCDDYLFVHAGVRPGVPLAKQDSQDFLWIREPFLTWTRTMLPDAPGLMIVHGHTPIPAPVILPNRIGIDTGAGKGGPLTCAVFEGTGIRWFHA